MKLESHRILGIYLAKAYLPPLSKGHMRAFLLGYTLPDRNPATYLKGSARAKWLRGHNWSNAHPYIHRLCIRLDSHQKPGIRDYYALGKLIHYTADAFTGPHNDYFSGSIRQHRFYEAQLQCHFLSSIPRGRPITPELQAGIMDSIRRFHRQYIHSPVTMGKDCRYSILATSTVLSILSPKTA